jgi:hypothetical protein
VIIRLRRSAFCLESICRVGMDLSTLFKSLLVFLCSFGNLVKYYERILSVSSCTVYSLFIIRYKARVPKASLNRRFGMTLCLFPQRSVGMATGFRTEGRVLIPGEMNRFIYLTASRSEAHSASHRMGTGCSFPWGKAAARFHIVPRSRMIELCLHSPIRFHGVVLK